MDIYLKIPGLRGGNAIYRSHPAKEMETFPEFSLYPAAILGQDEHRW